MCAACWELIQDCSACEYNGGEDYECTECMEGYEIWMEDNTCWESHCEIPSLSGGNTCQDCEEGFVLRYPENMCYEICPEGFVERNYNENYVDCVIDCKSSEETDSINNPNDPLKCTTCNDPLHGIIGCALCTSDDFGMSKTCVQCEDALVPDPKG